MIRYVKPINIRFHKSPTTPRTELIEAVRLNGITDPIDVISIPGTCEFQAINGAIRLRIAVEAGLRFVPVKVHDILFTLFINVYN